MATVSVIVPSYNHGRFLTACLDSVLAQTFTDWDLQLIDDGSTDDSVATARSYAARDPRIRVAVNDANLGTYATQQKCLKMSSGPLVAVMNSDDFWHPEKLAKQVAALETSPDATFSYVLGWKADDKGCPDEGEDVHAGWPTTPRQDLLPCLLNENRVLASGVVFRRKGLRFETSCRYSGDHVALLEASWRGPAVCVPERLTYWRMHENNSFTVSERQMLEEVRLREALLAHASDWRRARPGSGAVEEGLAANAQNLFAVYALLGCRGRAWRLGQPMLGHGPSRLRGLKRALGLFLPRRVVRDHFWSANPHAAGVSTDFRRLDREIRGLAPLKLDLA